MKEKNIMNYHSTHTLHYAQSILPHGSMAQPANGRDAEPAGLTPEEIRRIVLDVLG
jgi:hypothetical protein